MLSFDSHVLAGLARSRGFSLIEVLVAMAIMGLALTVLYQSSSSATRNARVASEYAEALALAESMLDAFSTQLSIGKQESGRFGEFDWIAIAEVPQADETQNVPAEAVTTSLVQVTLTVTWAGQKNARELTLQTVDYVDETTDD